MTGQAAFRSCDDGLLVFVRVTPKAAKDVVGGCDVAGDGREWLKIRVRAIPGKGAANTAVVRILAKALGCPKSTLSIRSGTTDRNKSILARISHTVAGVTEANLTAGQEKRAERIGNTVKRFDVACR